MDYNNNNGWDKYQLLVLSELKELKEGQEKLAEAVIKITVEDAILTTTLKRDTKWISVIGGFITFLVTSIVGFFISHK